MSDTYSTMTDHFPTREDLKDTHFQILLEHDCVLSLYNFGLPQNERYITEDVVRWIEAEAIRHGWRSVNWFTDSCTGRGCWLSLHEGKLPTVKKSLPATPWPAKDITLDDALSAAFTKIAQHSCRLGEQGNREWPPLVELPEPDSWKMVGRKYSREFAIEIMKIYFSKGSFLEDLARLAGRESD